MGGKSTTTSSAEPWGPIQPNLKDIAAEGKNLFEQGGFSADPYQGNRVAGFGDASQSGQQMLMRAAKGGMGGINTAQAALKQMMNGQGNANLEAVKQNALGSAIPAAASMFSGSGLTDSSMAMDSVGRAALDAVAPYEYDAWNQQQGNTLAAAGLMPQLQQAQYMPGQIMQSVGMMQDLMKQSKIDANMAKYYEGQMQGAENLQGYTNLLNPLATMGGSSESTTRTSPGIGEILGTGLQMLALFSDRRLKENVVRIGTAKGHNVYAFNYLWSPVMEVGVMADEVPHAVCGTVAGYAVVDYARL